jgi:IclR family transcriptional regulator, acetate operon repressor
MSATVDKALELLNLFTQARAHIGLSEIARLAGLDKATVHRMLGSLAKHGLVEQDEHSRLYRLGAGTLRLARNREASFPTAALVDDILQDLTAKTGETSHASLIAGGQLATIGLVSGSKTIHVTLDAGEALPFHATASGLACLAFLPPTHFASVMKRKMAAYTPHTPLTPEAVESAITHVRNTGYAVSDQSYESDVFGIAAPVFSETGFSCGAIAVATPAHRMTRAIKAEILSHVLDAALTLTRRMGAEPPAYFHALLSKRAA